jgi:hypothetical protein
VTVLFKGQCHEICYQWLFRQSAPSGPIICQPKSFIFRFHIRWEFDSPLISYSGKFKRFIVEKIFNRGFYRSWVIFRSRMVELLFYFSFRDKGRISKFLVSPSLNTLTFLCIKQRRDLTHCNIIQRGICQKYNREYFGEFEEKLENILDYISVAHRALFYERKERKN